MLCVCVCVRAHMRESVTHELRISTCSDCGLTQLFTVLRERIA